MYNLNTAAKFTPIKELSSDGKYSMQTLNQLIAGNNKSAYIESWSVSLEYMPHTTLKLLYRPSRNDTKIMKGGQEINAMQDDVYSINYAPFSFMSMNSDYVYDRYSLLNSQYDALPLQIKRDTGTLNLGLKLSPAAVLSTELSYSNKDTTETNIDFVSGQTRNARGTKRTFRSIKKFFSREFFSLHNIFIC